MPSPTAALSKHLPLVNSMQGVLPLMMDTMPMQDALPSPTKITGLWMIREREPKTGLVVAQRQVKNLLTIYGLTALASALSGNYTPPIYLVIENTTTNLNTAA